MTGVANGDGESGAEASSPSTHVDKAHHHSTSSRPASVITPLMLLNLTGRSQNGMEYGVTGATEEHRLILSTSFPTQVPSFFIIVLILLPDEPS
ncbi:hypothetical protein E3N88_21250 [Mikania micrantha]|uniref:Uncharacterized protein n=1 Tax=Mikania micrantha TaxID=192012 RepID=A0A5N6NM29_9ASTR|nr:hypothetical protein E3N88_21250 [Mikania micrantha]